MINNHCCIANYMYSLVDIACDLHKECITTVLVTNLTGTIAQHSNKLARAIDPYGFDQMLADSIRAVAPYLGLTKVEESAIL